MYLNPLVVASGFTLCSLSQIKQRLQEKKQAKVLEAQNRLDEEGKQHAEIISRANAEKQRKVPSLVLLFYCSC
jgi:hypothetical protein